MRCLMDALRALVDEFENTDVYAFVVRWMRMVWRRRPASARVHFAAMPLVLHSKSTLSLDGSRTHVDCLTFSRDGATLFVARYPTVFVVRVSDGATIDEIDVANPEFDATEEGDAYSERVREIAESYDGATLFVLCETMVSNSGDTFGWVQAHAREGGAKLWMAPSPDDEVPAPIDEEAGVTQVLCAPDGDRVALVSLDGVLFVSSRTGKKRATIAWDEDVAPYDHIAGAAYSADGARLWLAWSPQMRCYDSAKRSLVRVVEMSEDRSLFAYERAALTCVRPSDGRFTVLTRDRRTLIVVNPTDETVSARALDATAFTVHALLDGAERWLRSSADSTGPIAIESIDDVRVLEERGDSPAKWTALAVHEGASVLVARAHEAGVWLHRVVWD